MDGWMNSAYLSHLYLYGNLSEGKNNMLETKESEVKSVGVSSDHRVMDGMTEACVKGGIEAGYSSVSCACALLGALDELSQGCGIQSEQVRH